MISKETLKTIRAKLRNLDSQTLTIEEHALTCDMHTLFDALDEAASCYSMLEELARKDTERTEQRLHDCKEAAGRLAQLVLSLL